MKKIKSPYHGFRFLGAIRWYPRFNLSLRDIEELLLKHGVTVSYESVRRVYPARKSRALQDGFYLASRRILCEAVR